jgi:hypothetical protein
MSDSLSLPTANQHQNQHQNQYQHQHHFKANQSTGVYVIKRFISSTTLW